MKRDLALLANKTYDLLIIGGGIYGAAAAWDASLRGLKVALIDKGDFAAATSSNSLKTIHGGIRYLQHADIRRMRESIRERRVLMTIAPHLVHTLACIMPTYGHAIKGPEAMTIALLLNDLIGFDRNRLKDPHKRLPMGSVVSTAECKRLIPGVEEKNLNGGAVWHDCQVYNSERLVFSYLHSAVARGAELANYVQADSLLIRGERIEGVSARDVLSGQTFDIRAKITLNNTGPWVNDLPAQLNGKNSCPPVKLSTAMNVVVRRQLTQMGAGISGKKEFKDSDAVISKGARLYFIAPWRGVSMVGTLHEPYSGHPDDFQVTEQQVSGFLQDINQALPGADIKREEISLVQSGILPMAGLNAGTGDVQLEKHYRILEHGRPGFMSIVSVKYTTARDVAEKTVDAVFRNLQLPVPPHQSHRVCLHGGVIEDYRSFVAAQERAWSGRLEAGLLQPLLKNYGSAYGQVLELAEQQPDLLQPLAAGSSVLAAEVIHGIRMEMAQSLSDVMMRRTELGTTGYPGDEAVQACVQLMAAELGWDAHRQRQDVEKFKAIYTVAN